MTLDSLYIGVPIGAFFCFLFIFFSFLNAADAKAVRYFRQILLSCLIWTGGMVMMRMQIMPGIRFWFHVSVFGLLTVPIFMYAFLWVQKHYFRHSIGFSYCISSMCMAQFLLLYMAQHSYAMHGPLRFTPGLCHAHGTKSALYLSNPVSFYHWHPAPTFRQQMRIPAH